MYHLGKFDKSQFTIPSGYDQHSQGYAHVSLVDHSVGSVHMGLRICNLEPKGWVASCIHANEKGIYVIKGEIEIMRGKEAFRLGADEYALIPYGDTHAFRNVEKQPVCWMETQVPQPKPPGGWQDMFFIGEAEWPKETITPDLTDPRTRYFGHFQEGRARIGNQGLTVYQFINQEFGAFHFQMMRGELAVGGVVGTHDHPIEESYFVLSGKADMEIEGNKYHLQPGDFAWTGVGTSHAFYQMGDIPWRWIEIQSPQFPSQHKSRYYAVWDRLRRSLPA
jgi:mannose-6-phosphate isomerase-like protein (cupin superfamily)